ncbi:hypothetical protein [Actibacterium sp. MT2.3-13A]|uniref:hypothetical protein n=1 Tax=Actibacterium sp. MT2.3-13A TaxID=2828332 RepID=UPI001BA5DD94|nr:hypothetical protein [Actibacterium sp. MT2.3-13A]
MKRIFLSAALTALPLSAQADDVTDTLKSAIEAYEAGDVQYALEEIAFARQLLQAMKTEGLAGFLPPPPEGWSREVNTEMSAGMAMFGGGTGAEAEYTGAEARFTVTLMADTPMVAAMAGMFANPMIMAASGRIIRVGRQKFLDQDGELTGLINGRVLVQASGADVAVMLPVLEAIDFEGLGAFGL